MAVVLQSSNPGTWKAKAGLQVPGQPGLCSDLSYIAKPCFKNRNKERGVKERKKERRESEGQRWTERENPPENL